MFPIHLQGSAHFAAARGQSSATTKAIANRIAALLDEKDCDEVFIEGNRVRFHNKWFGHTIRFGFGSDSDDLGSSYFDIFGSGTFDIDVGIDGATVRFNLSLARMWICVALITAVFCFANNRFAGNWEALWPFPLAFLGGFVVLNMIYLWGRVWFSLRQNLRDLPELQKR